MKEIRNLPRVKVLHHFFEGGEISDHRRFQKADQKNEDMDALLVLKGQGAEPIRRAWAIRGDAANSNAKERLSAGITNTLI
jgi:hypothetical protein